MKKKYSFSSIQQKLARAQSSSSFPSSSSTVIRARTSPDTAHDTHDIESARRTHAIAHATPHGARMQPPAPAATSSPAATATASPAATATAATATPSLTPKRRTRRTSNHAVSPPLDKLSEKPKLEACRAKDGGGREETRRVRRPHPAPAALPVGSRRVANDTRWCAAWV